MPNGRYRERSSSGRIPNLVEQCVAVESQPLGETPRLPGTQPTDERPTSLVE